MTAIVIGATGLVGSELTRLLSTNEQFDRIAKSITTNNYSIPLIGFSWDANSPLNKSGWEIAKKIAANNGQKKTCPVYFRF